MFTPLPTASDAHALQTFREILAGLDPEARIVLDSHTGEIRVKGQFDTQQLAAAVERAGLERRVAIAGEGGCCGSCGCA